MNKILERVNKENAERFGPLCEGCEKFEKYCNCKSRHGKEEDINIEPIPEGDVGEYIKRIIAYFKKPLKITDHE